MLGFMSFTNTRPPISSISSISPIPSIPITNPLPKHQSLTKSHSFLKSYGRKHRGMKAWSFSEDKEELSEKQEEEEDVKKEKNDERPRFNLRWSELLFDPDPNNVVAVGLTGVLAWASVQVLWQLFVISFAILVAALKYSFIAAILIFILITLL